MPHCARTMQGQPAAVQDCASLRSRCAPVATAVCAGFADHRAELRLSPRSGARDDIGSLRTGTGVRWFPEPRLQSGATRPRLRDRTSPRVPATASPRVPTTATSPAVTHTRRRPRRKAQEVVEEPRRQVVVLRREMANLSISRRRPSSAGALGLPRRDGAVARVALRRRAPGMRPPVVRDQLEEGQHGPAARLLDHRPEHVVAPPLFR